MPEPRQKVLSHLILCLILAVALFLRLYHIAWDGGYLFHPDERQILVVADELAFPWPPRWSLLLSPKSPWNPKFFAYGSLPIYLLRICANLAGHLDARLASLDSSFYVGRVLSALFDVGTVLLLYHLGRELYGRSVGLLAAFLLAFTVLHVQMAHFYTVDTMLVFFVFLTLYLAESVVRRPRLRQSILLGGAWGLALATKVSAVPLAVPISLAWLWGVLARRQKERVSFWLAIGGLIFTGGLALIVFLLCEPYALLDIVAFVVDVFHEGRMARGTIDLPYTRQFAGTLPYLYPLWQTGVWSLGIPLGIGGFGGALAALFSGIRLLGRDWRKAGPLLVPLSWAWIYFGIVGSFHAKFLRYMLPIIPLFCLWAAWGIDGLVRWTRGKGWPWRGGAWLFGSTVLVGTVLYCVAFLHVYRQEHPWIQATRWLCHHVPIGSCLMIEHWDDPLPMKQGIGELQCYNDYCIHVFPAYDPDDEAKLQTLLDYLEQSDYIVLSSNRLYDTIPRLPQRYPITSRYYELLFGERLGFELVYYVAVYPQIFGIRLVHDTFIDPPLPRPRLFVQREARYHSINLGKADESFSVYDHPMPLVFQKKQRLSREQLLVLFKDVRASGHSSAH